ncbi:hypothetical protein V8G54_026392 [Vigna mungo]|uniref:Alcohol dehydrogenase-like C-terminal domain-containing protein n=1 Tax=Vigna mungo TaxID=3915 RepID=A0AAQ3MZI0_VIGMU
MDGIGKQSLVGVFDYKQQERSNRTNRKGNQKGERKSFISDSYVRRSINVIEASAIPFAALTAWRGLKCTARISEGQRILVVGGGGAVGLAAIQLAVAAGCSVVTTCGSQSVERLLAAGAEQAVDYVAEVDAELAVKGKFDAVLDTIGVSETERIGINFLKRGGHYMTLQGEAASLADRYGLAIGLPAATALLLNKQLLYRCTRGIVAALQLKVMKVMKGHLSYSVESG